jgi:ER lumen protein retaining receptor
VDGEDISRGWLISKIIGQKGNTEHDDDDDAGLAGQEEGIIRPTSNNHRAWGPRGISVSADDGTHEAEHTRLADPAAFEDDYDYGDDAVVVSPAVSEVDRASIKARDEDNTAKQAGVSDGVEWRDDHHS